MQEYFKEISITTIALFLIHHKECYVVYINTFYIFHVVLNKKIWGQVLSFE